MNPAVLCKGVTKSYSAGGTVTPALRGIDLEINEGELFMLVGPSGCGKTTLISVIAGILNQDGGECKVFGQDLRALDEAALTTYRGNRIGFVFQSYNLIPALTATENVMIPLLLNRVGWKEAFTRAAEMLSQVGLGSKTRARPSELSGGQQQRVAIARALVHNPGLIVCDEPTSALDHRTGGEIMDLFREEALKQKRTLVIVTHDARIFSYADRMALMDDGRIVRIGSSAGDIEMSSHE